MCMCMQLFVYTGAVVEVKRQPQVSFPDTVHILKEEGREGKEGDEEKGLAGRRESFRCIFHLLGRVVVSSIC